MKNVMHFESEKQYQFNECPKCYKKTKNKRIHFYDVVKEEQNEVNFKNQNITPNKLERSVDERKTKKKIKTKIA
jgi:hypothetical protein